MPCSPGCRHRLASLATCVAGSVTLYLVPPAISRLGRLPRSRLWLGFSVAPLAMGDPARFAQIATLAAFVAATRHRVDELGILCRMRHSGFKLLPKPAS